MQAPQAPGNIALSLFPASIFPSLSSYTSGHFTSTTMAHHAPPLSIYSPVRCIHPLTPAFSSPTFASPTSTYCTLDARLPSRVRPPYDLATTPHFPTLYPTQHPPSSPVPFSLSFSRLSTRPPRPGSVLSTHCGSRTDDWRHTALLFGHSHHAFRPRCDNCVSATRSPHTIYVALLALSLPSLISVFSSRLSTSVPTMLPPGLSFVYSYMPGPCFHSPAGLALLRVMSLISLFHMHSLGPSAMPPRASHIVHMLPRCDTFFTTTHVSGHVHRSPHMPTREHHPDALLYIQAWR